MWETSAPQSNEWYVFIKLSKYQPILLQFSRLNYEIKMVYQRVGFLYFSEKI